MEKVKINNAQNSFPRAMSLKWAEAKLERLGYPLPEYGAITVGRYTTWRVWEWHGETYRIVRCR